MTIKKFTLIEVLVALGVFIVGVAPLLGVLTAMTKNHRDFKESEIASSFIEYQISYINDDKLYLDPVSFYDDSVDPPIINKLEANNTDRGYYFLKVKNVSEGLQHVGIYFGSAANLQSINFSGVNDPRILSRASFIHQYE